MAKNIWEDNEERVSEYELIAEDAQQAEQLAAEYDSASSAIVEAGDEALDEIAEDSAFSLTRSESNVVFNARLRLEQAKLYEMLINHNLFEGVDSSPEAIQNVQNEVKFYIIKRLESLLGIREPTVRIESTGTIELPFNDIELDFLKQLAYKGTLGASATGKPVQSSKVETHIKPVTANSSKNKLKPMVSAPKKASPPPIAPQQAAPAKKAPVAPQASAKPAPKAKANPERAPNVKLRDSGMGRDLTKEEVIELAKAELKTASKKQFHEMNAKEKAEKIREVNDRHKRPTSSKAMPLPSANELEMKYRNQEANRSMSRNQADQFNTILANALASQKNRGDED